ncbi:hypothetical protein [Escherichia coli]
MTVSTEVNHNEYTGNGVTTSFPYTFRIFHASDLVVTTSDTNGTLRTLTLNTDYTVTGAGSYSGGTVVLPVPLGNAWGISIARELPVVQETDLRNQGKFFAETHENAFDYLTMLIQQAIYKTSFLDSRAIKVPERGSWVAPNIARRRNKIFAWGDSGEPLAVLPESGSATDVLIELAKPTGSDLVGGLPFDSMYGDLSTTEDNTMSINERLNWSRKTGKTVELPAGRFKVSGELELGGVKLRGRSIGFRNSDGTVLVGVGQDRLFNQSESTFPYFASTKLESLRIENVNCGLEFGYLNRAEFEDVHIQCTGTGVRFGRAGNSGPQWNTMRRCTVESIGGSALYMNGAAWCNNNTFELCFFESKQNGLNPAVVIDCAGGFGAIDNLFIGTEIASEGYGVRLKNARATHLLGAYLECYGPAIWLNGTSYGTKVSGGVFARQRNDNVTGVNWAIYHQSGNAFIEIDKPYIVISNPSEQDGCGFIGYSGVSPASGLVVDVTSDPHTENVGGVSYTRYQDGLFSKISKINHGDQVIRSNESPSLSLQYEDGTKKIELYSNSKKDGSDFGGVLKVNDIARMQFTADGTKILLPGQKIGLPAEANTSAPGTKTHRIQVLSETGAFLGYLAVYSS